MSQEHVVVVGGGQAGSSLVAKLRNAGHAGPIDLICAEPVPPYQRPPLSKKYMLGEMELERLFLRPAEFYEGLGITLHLGVTVEGIDPEARRLTLSTGGTLGYDQLALTTGSVPRRLPAAMGDDLEGVFTVRDLADADAMAPYVRDGGRVLIVGGGYIGLEAAAVCAQKGMQVTLVEMAPRILQRVAAEETSDFFRALHAGHGVDIREGTGLERLTGEGHVSGAVLADGTTLEVDMVVVGVGILPDTALAEAAGLALDNGIRTDDFGRTSDPHIWAAGDCASFPLGGAWIRLESVGNAIDQAEIVAQNILGAGLPYVPKPWFWSDQYDVKLQIAGLNTGHDRVVARRDGAGLSHWYYAGDRLVAIDAMNDGRAYMVGKRLIEGGKSPAPEVIADPATDLKALLKA